MARLNSLSHLGAGPRFPLRQMGNGFEMASGSDLVFSSVPYILLTRGDGPFGEGEQPWDTGFGSQLSALLHSGLAGDDLRDVVTEYIVTALAKNEPRIVVGDVRLAQEPNTLGGYSMKIEISAGLIAQDTEANQVRLEREDVISLSLPLQ